MVAGGGASVIYSDTVCALGGSEELANYGEYSGAPSEQQTYDYARTLLGLMTKEKHPDGKVRKNKILKILLQFAPHTFFVKSMFPGKKPYIFISIGIDHWRRYCQLHQCCCDLQRYCQGPGRVPSEAQRVQHQHLRQESGAQLPRRVEVIVSSFILHFFYLISLKKLFTRFLFFSLVFRVMRDVGKNLNIPLHVFGPETHMTAIVGMALGKREIPTEAPSSDSATTANFLLPSSVSSCDMMWKMIKIYYYKKYMSFAVFCIFCRNQLPRKRNHCFFDPLFHVDDVAGY